VRTGPQTSVEHRVGDGEVPADRLDRLRDPAHRVSQVLGRDQRDTLEDVQTVARHPLQDDRSPEQRRGGHLTEAHHHLGGEEAQLRLQVRTAANELVAGGTAVLRGPAAHGGGEPDLLRVDADGRERVVEQVAGGAGEGGPEEVLVTAWRRAHDHQPCARRPVTGDRAPPHPVEPAGGAGADRAQVLTRGPDHGGLPDGRSGHDGLPARPMPAGPRPG
jgi:hypothetical protein